jgi:hypothetical protein
MKCLITEQIIPGDEIAWGARDMARIRCEPPPRATGTLRYQNTQTKEEYLCLAGGFAWPGTKPGFAVVVAVRQSENESPPSFVTIAEVEEHDVEALLERTWELYLRYGANCNGIPWAWYGDPEASLSSFLARFMRKLRSAGEDRAFSLIYPPHYQEPGAFESYCRTLYSLLRSDRKQLVLGDCVTLRAHLNELKNFAVAKGATEECPAITAAGCVVTALLTYEPWLTEAKGPTTGDELDAYDPWAGYR